MSDIPEKVERVADALITVLASHEYAGIAAGVSAIMRIGSEANIAAFKNLLGQTAISAMREPTDAMIDAADSVGGIGDGGWTERAKFYDEYQAAIDEALTPDAASPSEPCPPGS